MTKNNTFTVAVNGIELSPEAAARLNSALQKAALSEIASLDLRGHDLVVSPVLARLRETNALGGGGQTGGIWMELAERAIEREL